ADSPQMARERRRVFYRGRVQGVGFRYTAVHVARGFDVVGTVRNLHDGRVELVAEAEISQLDGFLDAIAREMGGNIRGTDVELVPLGDPPLSGFSIRY